MVIGVDPGPVKSALCMWDGKIPFYPKYSENHDILDDLSNLYHTKKEAILAVERPVCQKWAGAEVSDTAIEAGRFLGVWGHDEQYLINRSKIRWHIGKVKQTNDSIIRQALIDRIHPDYDRLYNPGVLIGITGDIWQALAVAVTCCDLLEKGETDGLIGIHKKTT